MSLKQLLPLSVRDNLRPMYQSLQAAPARWGRYLSESSLWPKPAGWYTLRQELESVHDAASLYHIAAREFGILQIENEIVPFLEYVAAQQPKVVGEIGLKHGGNTFLFTRLFRQVRRLIAIDLILQNVGKAKFLAPTDLELTFLEGSSYSQPVIDATARRLGSDRFDFLFIDGDHEYDGVLKDFLAYYSLVRPGGFIALHDIVPDEEARTGKRSPTSNCWGGGVYLLWRQIREHFPHREFVQSWDQHGFGIGVITKTDAELPVALLAQVQQK